MQFDDVRRALRECDEFQDFAEPEMGYLLILAKPVHFEDKQIVFRKGDPRTSAFYLLVSGQFEILAGDQADPASSLAGVEAIVYPSDIIGEIGQVSPQGTRTRTVRAGGENTNALEWDFRVIREKMPKAADKLVKRFEDLAFERLSQQGMQQQ
jgi:CRP-like cAMP-binding protein